MISFTGSETGMIELTGLSSANWNDSPPDTLEDALNRLAKAVVVLQRNTPINQI